MSYKIRRIAIDSAAWTAITVPVVSPARHMDSVSIRCDDGAMRVRSDDTDASTEDLIAATVQQIINPPLRHARGDLPRFLMGSTVIYARMSAGAGTVIAHMAGPDGIV